MCVISTDFYRQQSATRPGRRWSVSISEAVCTVISRICWRFLTVLSGFDTCPCSSIFFKFCFHDLVWNGGWLCVWRVSYSQVRSVCSLAVACLLRFIAVSTVIVSFSEKGQLMVQLWPALSFCPSLIQSVLQIRIEV